MSREIKFRAWDRQEKKMHEVLSIHLRREKVIISNKPFGNVPLWDYDLMQYTGLKDKNGKEIYEGDIIKSEWQYDGVINRDITSVGQVAFGGNDGEPGFFMYGKDGDIYQPFVSYDRVELLSVEVIGNIYENPELLKEGN